VGDGFALDIRGIGSPLQTMLVGYAPRMQRNAQGEDRQTELSETIDPEHAEADTEDDFA
jgi:hypothetical protein